MGSTPPASTHAQVRRDDITACCDSDSVWNWISISIVVCSNAPIVAHRVTDTSAHMRSYRYEGTRGPRGEARRCHNGCLKAGTCHTRVIGSGLALETPWGKRSCIIHNAVQRVETLVSLAPFPIARSPARMEKKKKIGRERGKKGTGESYRSSETGGIRS